MSGKVFSSPGVSSKPLNLWDRWVEFYRSQRWGYNRYTPGRIVAIIRWKLRRRDKSLDSLLKALEGGGYEVQPFKPGRTWSEVKVESLEATMTVVTFDESHLRLRKHWWNRRA